MSVAAAAAAAAAVVVDFVSVNQMHGAEVASAAGESPAMQYQTEMHNSVQGESLLSVTTELSGIAALHHHHHHHHHHPIQDTQFPLANRHYQAPQVWRV
jgi:hypothetical protein